MSTYEAEVYQNVNTSMNNIPKRKRQARSNLRSNQMNSKQAFVNYKVKPYISKGNAQNYMIYKTNNPKPLSKTIGNMTITQNNRRRSNKTKVVLVL